MLSLISAVVLWLGAIYLLLQVAEYILSSRPKSVMAE
jgi:hypothetical protein